MTSAMDVKAERLQGGALALEPVAESHREGMREAAGDERIWQNTPLGASFDSYFDSLLALRQAGFTIPFAVALPGQNKIIGATRLMDIVREHRRLEIGGTWYHPDYWGGTTNPQAKLLLLSHAFDSAGAHRVQLLTDVRNVRSQAAIAKLGAVREGIVRDHMIVDGGRRRDSMMFSIIKEEWPTVRDGLNARVNRSA